MKKILADQNFTGAILQGITARIPDLDVVRTEDVGIKRYQDEQILDWACENGRVVLTHDAKTFVNTAYDRLAAGKSFPGVILVPANLTIGDAIEELVTLLTCSEDNELNDRVIRLPL